MTKRDRVDDGATLGLDGLIRYFVAVALVLAIPWFVVGASSDGGRNNVWIPCLLIAGWSGLRLSWLIVAGVPRLFEFSFWLYCYIFMGLAPAAQIHGDNISTTTPGVLASRDAATVVVVMLGIAAFEVGAMIRRSNRAERDAPALATTPEQPPTPAQTPAQPPGQAPDPVDEAASSTISRSLLLLAAALPVAVVFIATIGPGNFFTNRNDFADVGNRRFDSTLFAVLAAVSWVPAMVVLHRIISRRRARRGAKLNGAELIAVTVAVAMVVFANNPLTSSRYAFGSMALSLLVLLGGCATIARTRRTMLILLLGFLVVFPIADTFRRSERADVNVSLLDEYSGNPDYDSFAQISNSIAVVEDEGMSFLRQPLGVALFWVPRSVWDDKPIDTGEYIAEARGYDFTNLSAPLWAELYMVGGHLTVIIGFLGLGYIVVAADRRLIRGLGGKRAYSVTGAFMPFYLIILLRGSLLQAMALVAALFVSVWFTRPIIRNGESPVAEEPEEAPPPSLFEDADLWQRSL